jgi:hypothetical protein
MILSKPFQSNDNNLLMDTHNIVGSTTASGDDNTNFELETITSTYIGLMRIYRLLYVADHCATLRNEVLLASLKYLQETHFTSLYKQVKIFFFIRF